MTAPDTAAAELGRHYVAGHIEAAERFLDPTTDRLMRVWLDPATRVRHYVAEPRS